jgi:hypothetical protein
MRTAGAEFRLAAQGLVAERLRDHIAVAREGPAAKRIRFIPAASATGEPVEPSSHVNQ